LKSNKFFRKNNIFIVAEIGNNHEGNFKNAIKLIDKASEAKVDAVKFQSYSTEGYLSNSIDEKRKKLLKKFQFSSNEFKKLAAYTKKKGLIFFSTPLDLKSCDYLNKIQPIFKIASGDNNHEILIKKIIKFNKPTIISTGMLNYNDVLKLYKFIKRLRINSKLGILHCVSSYPALPEELNLNSIMFLKKKFPNCHVGYSDHSTGIEACIVAASMGAEIIEKHFTLNHNFSKFRDHKLSADPTEMSLLVKRIREIEMMKGKFDKIITKNEKKNKINIRRSIAANRTLEIGHTIKESNLIMLRPGTGYEYKDRKFIIGKKVVKVIRKNEILKRNFIR
jgi:N,N'-diacetyllegionaminate synthase